MVKKAKKRTLPATEDERFEKISERVVSAFEELNDALAEAHGCKSMTVGLKMSSAVDQDETFPWKPEAPTRFLYHIGRIVKCSFELSLKTEGGKGWKEEWKQYLFSPSKED